jgi:hypothetical protein
MKDLSIQQSRLDYFIINQGLSYGVTECNINNSYLSDHNIISIRIATAIKHDKKRGLWKFNNTLLTDNEYISKINPLFTEWEDKHKAVKELGLKWEVIKTEIRSFTISYCSHKTKIKKKEEHDLINEIKHLDNELCQNPCDNIKQRYVKARKPAKRL